MNNAFRWFAAVMLRYADFTGRARRAEYWWFMAVFVLIFMVLAVLDNVTGTWNEEFGAGLLSGLFMLACLIPSLSVGARRLHDTNRSGWWQLINFVPLIGFVVLIFFLVQDSQPGDNRFGPNPKASG